MKKNALWLCLFACATVPVAPSASGHAVLFRHVRVFDGERVLPARNVLVVGDRIDSFPEGDAVPAGAEVVDGEGATLLPGLIDSHVHVHQAGDLRQMAVFGVTTALDMMDPPSLEAELKKTAEGDPALADLRSAGNAATVPGGHGTEYGLPVPTLTAAGEAQAFVDARIAEGSDYIKIVYDDGKGLGFSVPTLSRDTLQALIDAAHHRGKLAVVHIGSQVGARDAIAAGADAIVHTFADASPDADFAARVAAQHAFVVPTLEVLGGVFDRRSGAALAGDVALAPFLYARDLGGLGESFPLHLPVGASYENAAASVRALKGMAVPILAGTDAPNPGTAYGVSLHGELELLVRAGLSPAEALAAATSAPAREFALADRGVIRPGARADLLLVDGDPTQEITRTRKIRAVFVRGHRVDRETYRAEAARDRERAAGAAVATGAGLVSDFDDLKPSSTYGQGWAVSTDALIGGHSRATVEPVTPGARGSRGALEIKGDVWPGLAYAWAGAMFFPGARPMDPVDWSSRKGISFWAKGDGKEYRILLFDTKHGRVPRQATFTASAAWSRQELPFSKFDQVDGHGVIGLAVVAGPAPGTFALQIDEVRVE